LKKADIKGNPKKFIFCLGQDMFVKGVDEFLIGKEIGEHKVELSPEKAFGKRDPKLIQMIPRKIFLQHQVNPLPGAMFNFDGNMAKVLTVSGGRVMVDFNNPIAGKEVEYKINVLRKIEDINEKIDALNDFFFRQKFEFEVKEKEFTIKVKKDFVPLFEMFKQKYEEMLDLTLKVELIQNEKN
jgi:FKBP-type peptidyl-prolyl cis-trans isomerase 2